MKLTDGITFKHKKNLEIPIGFHSRIFMKIGKLEKVDLRKVWPNEASDFTVWIENNVDHLSDFLGFKFEITDREKKVGNFKIDLLAETPNGEKIIIENQLEKTDHSHLGQIITYFTNLEEQVKIIVWIAKEVRPEHENAINWLNKFTDIKFYLVQVEAYRIGNSEHAPYFKIVCEPDENIKAIGTELKEFSEREKFNVRFWETMMESCKGRLDHFCNKKASKYHFFQGSSGKGGTTFVFLATGKFYGIELYIDCGDENKNYEFLMQLKNEKVEIEKEFGHLLIWDEIEDKRACRIRYHIKETSILEVDLKRAQEEMITCMEKFEKVFRPRLKKVNFSKEAA
jgi:hypothetical protein